MDEAGKRGMSRRDFVAKLGVGVAAATAALGTGAVLSQALPQRTRGMSTQFLGARVLPPGPAPTGLPLIPIRALPDGTLEGVPSHLAWYRYCTLQRMPGVAETYVGDNLVRYDQTAPKLEVAKHQGTPQWYEDRLGQVARAEDFVQVGQGAPVRWRSEGLEDELRLRAIVIRVDPSQYAEPVRSEFVPEGLVGVLAACTHFCCWTGWKENDNPKAQVPGQGVDGTVIYCSCHDARFDPTDIRPYKTPADNPGRFP